MTSPPAQILERFSPATREWFTGAFDAPTAAQAQAWQAISTGDDTLVVAPTGSGKTLSAFLWSLDRLTVADPPDDVRGRCRVLYVSPLKALAVDVERNLRSPLVGIGHAAERLGLPRPDIRVGTRSGDTPQAERRDFAKRPPDILITTPESLFLLLTSKAREALSGVETVIVDEIHAMAGTKRGAHLAVTLARLDALLPRPAQRIGLSATVRPVEHVARFLTAGAPATVVQPPSAKEWDLEVVVPVPDLADLGQPTDDLSGPAAGAVDRTSIWPHVEERIVDLVTSHSSTLVFANSRRLAERLTSRLNEIWAERLDAAATADAGPAAGDSDRVRGGERPSAAESPLAAVSTTAQSSGPPAQVMAQAGVSAGADPVLARAHHGSVSKEQRAVIEDDLKAGRLPAVVATSSLELGIDMGAIDLVIQVESPPSVAGGLQRVGRAGHQVGAVSRGVFFPKYRGDLVQTAVVVESMRAGAIESVHVPANPLDVLAQQVVAMCALDDWAVDDLLALLRRSAPFATLGQGVLESVLDMLAGRYPSDEFAELRPRIVWDRITGVLTGRPGAQRLAVTSGGTIPDRGLYGVFLAGSAGPGRRVGELDEEMVYESRVGDVFTLGTSSWRIEDITHDQVLVTPAPGAPGKLPFWKGDTLGRPAELGRAVGTFVRELGALDDAAARERVAATGLDAWASDNLLAYLAEQRESTGVLPDDRTLVIERFRDEIGDWRVAVHSPYGGHVHAPWALCIAARMRERFGVEVQAMHADDGIVLRLPDVEFEGDRADSWGRDVTDAVTLAADDVRDLVTAEIGGSALFASRFRECAARALLLPRRNPGRRQALWQQRQRAAALLEVASRYPSFPIVLEAVRECVQDVFDVDALVDLLSQVASRTIRVVEIETPNPSPFARSLMFGYVAQYLYEGDSPLAERRAAALSLDPTLLGELLGADASALSDLLDPDEVARTEAELQRLVDERRARGPEEAIDLIRRIGPLTAVEVHERSSSDAAADVDGWLTDLEAARRLIRVRVAGHECWAVVEDAGRLRDGLGVALPVGVPEAFLAPVTDPLGDLVARHARCHGPFTAAQLSSRLGLGVAVATETLRRLAGDGRLVTGDLLPVSLRVSEESRSGPDFCDAQVLRTLRRRSLAVLRAEVEPVAPTDFARFLPVWQGVGGALAGVDGLIRAVEQLAGAVVPASALESLVLPARVRGYAPHLLDEVLASGEVLWQGHGGLGSGDGWVSLHPTDVAEVTLAPPDDTLTLEPLQRAVLDVLDGGGAYLFRSLVDATGSTDDAAVADALWALVWAGRVTGDGVAGLRALLGGPGSAHKTRRSPRRTSAPGLRGLRSGPRPSRPGAMVTRNGPPTTAGRWTAVPWVETDPTVRGHAAAEVLLERHGVVTRGAVVAEDVPGGFAAVYRVLAAAEDAGRVRRGYIVEGLGAAQFATAGAIDRVRALSRPIDAEADASQPPESIVLAATDPANPYGSALPWPDPTGPQGHAADTPDERAASGDTGRPGRGHRAARKGGSLVVLCDGALVFYVERGGRSLLTWSEDPAVLASAARSLAETVTRGTLRALTIEKVDGGPALGSPHPVVGALEEAGFHTTPRGLRLRR